MTKLFILHGWTYQTDTWQPLLEILRSRDVDFEFLHIPGLTDSTNPIWTLDDYVEWLRQKTSAYEKVILLGHSNGGRIALAFAAAYPEKVERLILEDSAGIPPRGWRAFKRDTFRLIAKVGTMLAKSATLRSLFYHIIRERDYRDATPEMRITMSRLVSADLSAILHKIKTPTLIIWGARDVTTPLSDGEIIRAGITNSRMIIIPDARHSPHRTHTERMAEIITEELRRV